MIVTNAEGEHEEDDGAEEDTKERCHKLTKTSVGDPNDFFSDLDPVFQTNSDSAPFGSRSKSK